jgi:hypothetical protein
MKSPLSLAQRRSRHAFTLTETALVLGIAGLILGAVWLAAASVLRNRGVTQTAENIAIVVQNMRSLYRGRSKFTAATGSDITTAMINTEIFPSGMLSSEVPPRPMTFWNTPIRLLVGASQTTFDIVMDPTLPTESCIGLAARMAGTGVERGLTEINLDGTTYTGDSLRLMTPTSLPNCTRATYTFNIKG